MDASVDRDAGAPDAALDGGSGAGAGTDASAPDAAADAGSPDAGSDPFAGCPGPGDAVGDGAWTNALQVTADALYCGRFNEGRTLPQELQTKVMLRIAAGSYALPSSGTGHPFRLPVCLLLGDGQLLVPGEGSADHGGSASVENVSFHQQLPAPDGRRFQGRLDFAGGSGGITLDGSENGMSGLERFSFELCDGGGDCYSIDAASFDSCSHGSSTLHRHRVSFEGGEVSFDLRIGTSFAGTEPGAFVRAWGTYQGTSFDLRDYFALVYNPEHHHFSRDFAVLFEAPIGGVCGLELGGLEPSYDGVAPADDTPDFGYAVDCGLARMGALGLTDHSHEKP